MVPFIDSDEAQDVSHICGRNVHTQLLKKNIMKNI